MFSLCELSTCPAADLFELQKHHHNAADSAPIVVIQEGVFTDITKGLTIFVKKREGKYDFSHIFVHDKRDPEKNVEVVAESGSILINSTPPKIIFNNGTRSEFTAGQSQAAILELTVTRLT